MNHQVQGHGPRYYQIKIAGQLNKSWSTWLNYTEIAYETNENTQVTVSVLTCPIIDQPALRGLLNKLFDLNLTILSINRCNPDIDTNKLRETKE